MRTHFVHLTLALLGSACLTACEEELPPRSVDDFVENPIMLEAAMVRCAQDRSKTRYDAECINARQAVTQIEAKEEAARRVEFEARSERKRQSLRRTQAAAAQARRRAAEAERLRKESEYLAQFGVLPPAGGQSSDDVGDSGNTPQAVIPAGDEPAELPDAGREIAPSIDGGNAPVVVAEPEKTATDLGSIRDELQRRNEEGD